MKKPLLVFSIAIGLSATQSRSQFWSLTGDTLHSDTGTGSATVNMVGGSPANSVADGTLGATIAGGGSANPVWGSGAAISSAGNFSFIGGGANITIDAGSDFAVIGGGRRNRVGVADAFIGGGSVNTALGYRSAIVGGFSNHTEPGADYSLFGGGHGNFARGSYATIPGGFLCEANGDFSFAAGRKARANHSGSWVWADDSHTSYFDSTSENQFLIRAAGGVGVNTTTPQSALDVAGEIRCTVLELTSDRNAKDGFQPVDNQSVLNRVVSLPLTTWHYSDIPAVRHIGPMAQDFKAAFPQFGSDDKHIASVDADGVALASIQALYALAREKDDEIAALKLEMSKMKVELVSFKGSVTDRLAALEKAMSKDVLHATFHEVVSE